MTGRANGGRGVSSGRLRVLVDAAALADERRDAGIGRYERRILVALRADTSLDLDVVTPPSPPRSESRPGRFLHAQPSLLRAALHPGHDLSHGLGGEPVAVVRPRRQVVTVHDVELWGQRRPAGWRGAGLASYRRALAVALRACGAIITVSRTVATEAEQRLGLDPARIHVVPHGVDPVFTAMPADDDALRRDRLGVAQPYLLWTGSLRRHDPRKALDVLLDAVASLVDLATPPVLVLAGARGVEANRVEADARRRGVATRFPGHVDDDDLAALLRGASALVLASLHEGFGLPVLEAMACGVPVVATFAGNLPELAGDAALLVPRGDAGELAAALRRATGDAAVAERLRRAGPVRAAEFTWQRAAERTAAVYHRLAGR